MPTAYNLEDKYRAAVAYLMIGTVNGAAKEVGIPQRTLQDWSKTDWWEEMLQKAIGDVNSQLRATGLRIVAEATKAVLDRLEHGDEVSDKKGALIRRKVPLRDALLASLTWFDKTRIINEQALNHSNQRVEPKDLLKQMQEIGKAMKEQKLEQLSDLPEVSDEEEEQADAN